MRGRDWQNEPLGVIGAMAIAAAAVAGFAWLRQDAIEANPWVLLAIPAGLVVGTWFGFALSKRSTNHSTRRPAISIAAAAGLGIFIARAFPLGAVVLVLWVLGAAIGVGSLRAATLWRGKRA